MNGKAFHVKEKKAIHHKMKEMHNFPLMCVPVQFVAAQLCPYITYSTGSLNIVQYYTFLLYSHMLTIIFIGISFIRGFVFLLAMSPSVTAPHTQSAIAFNLQFQKHLSMPEV